MNPRTVFLAAAVICASVAVSTVPQVASGAAYPDDLVWLALGDSYSSGEGLPKNDRGANPVDKDCQRGTGDTGIGDGSESRAYGVAAYDALRGDMANSTFRLLACTGAISNDVHQQYRDEWLNEGESKADLITISIGGNNIGFAKTIARCIGLEPDNSTGAGIVLNPAIGCDTDINEQRSNIDQLIGTGTEGEQAPDGGQTLRDMYIEMAKQAVHPGGNIVITGYPNLIEESGRWTLGWFEGNRCSRVRRSDTAMLRSGAGYLNEQIALLSQELSGTNDVTFTFVDTSQVYENNETGRHGLCTGEPWINGLLLEPDRVTEALNRSFHPNQLGHNALGAKVAEVVSKLIWNNLNRSSVPPEPTATAPSAASILATVEVPALCGQDAGRLVDGELPIERIAGQPDPGFLTMILDGAVSGQFDQDPALEYASSVVCSAGGVSHPEHLLVYDDDLSLIADIEVPNLWPGVTAWRGGISDLSWEGNVISGVASVESSGNEAPFRSWFAIETLPCITIGDVDTNDPTLIDYLTGQTCGSEPSQDEFDDLDYLPPSLAEDHFLDYLLTAGARKYTEAWEMLSGTYQDDYGTFEKFVAFWDRIETVALNSMDTTVIGTVPTSKYTIRADVSYRLRDGGVSNEIVEVDITVPNNGATLISAYRFINTY